jgi:predicted AlkP superfamily phosphohydrolase/phosphomutase
MKVGVFNVPGTYPPYPVNGFMVSGFPVPPRAVWSYPRELMNELNHAVGRYEIDIPLTKPSELKGGENAFLAQVERLHTKSLQAAKFLIQSYRPDVFMMTLQGIDLVHHDFWKYMDDQGSRYRNVLHDWYRKLDAAVGEIRQLVEPETHTLVLSDHGSAPVSMALYVNEYLERNGLLTLKGKVKEKGGNYTKLRNTLMRNVPTELIATLYGVAPRFISRKLTGFAAIDRILQGIVENIDWNRTLAYSTGGHQAHIYINYRLVERTGGNSGTQSVPSLVSRLVNLMSQLTDPKTGAKLHPIFHFKAIAFKGPYEDEAPDLCVELYTDKEKVQVNPRVGTNRLWSFSPHYSSVHTREGVWGLTGPRIRSGLELDAGLLDMAPTLLKLLEIDGQADFDGKPLSAIFS